MSLLVGEVQQFRKFNSSIVQEVCYYSPRLRQPWFVSPLTISTISLLFQVCASHGLCPHKPSSRCRCFSAPAPAMFCVLTNHQHDIVAFPRLRHTWFVSPLTTSTMLLLAMVCVPTNHPHDTISKHHRFITVATICFNIMGFFIGYIYN